MEYLPRKMLISALVITDKMISNGIGKENIGTPQKNIALLFQHNVVYHKQKRNTMRFRSKNMIFVSRCGCGNTLFKKYTA